MIILTQQKYEIKSKAESRFGDLCSVNFQQLKKQYSYRVCNPKELLKVLYVDFEVREVQEPPQSLDHRQEELQYYFSHEYTTWGIVATTGCISCDNPVHVCIF